MLDKRPELEEKEKTDDGKTLTISQRQWWGSWKGMHVQILLFCFPMVLYISIVI